MKMFSIIALSILGFAPIAQSTEQTNPLVDISRIECQRSDGSKDFWTLTPNVFSHNGKNFVAVSGYQVRNYSREDGSTFEAREEKSTYFYEATAETDHNGINLIRLSERKYQFGVDREVSLTTSDFKTGNFVKIAFQPGSGGYGIPEGTSQTKIYTCEFLSR